MLESGSQSHLTFLRTARLLISSSDTRKPKGERENSSLERFFSLRISDQQKRLLTHSSNSFGLNGFLIEPLI